MIDGASHLDHFFYYGKADAAIVKFHKVPDATAFAQFSTIESQHQAGDLSGDEYNDTMQLFDGTNAADNNGTAIPGSEQSSGFQNTILNEPGGLPASQSIDEQGTPIADSYKADPVVATLHPILNAWFGTAV